MNSTYMDENQEQLAIYIKNVCKQYGAFGNIFNHTLNSITDSNRTYIIAGIFSELEKESLPEWVFPEDIIRRQQQNQKLFYTSIWAFDLTLDTNDVRAVEQLVDYLKKLEFLNTIYSEYDVELPDKIRESEIGQLINFYDMSHNYQLDVKTMKKCQDDLKWFFKREKCKGFRRSWLDYFRSEKFPNDKGAVARINGYLCRKKQIVPMEQLFDSNDNIKKLEMQEYEYRQFAKWMKNVYPQITYAIGKIDKVDHGCVGNAPETYSVLGKRVTSEEYAKIRKEKFATEGWSALENMVTAYWEFRDVYYKVCDEPLIASAYNAITLEYAQCNLLSDIQGELCLINVPCDDFMNFVSLAKANKVKFYIDNIGDYAIPSLEDIHVIYSEHQSEMVYGIMERLVNDKANDSHII